jgi:uncharacterized protein
LVQAHGGYPQPLDRFINDYAQLLTPEDAAQIRQLFSELEQKNGIEATVVTIQSIQDYGTHDETIEAFVTHLFNTWGIGDKTRNNGVLILVAARDRRVRIEVGSGYGDSQNAAMQEVINEHMLPSFKQNNYSRGLYRGARAVVGKLTGQWPQEVGISTLPNNVPVASATPANFLTSFAFWPILLGSVILIGAGGLGLQHYRRYRRRKCPHCRTEMKCLDEQADNAYLDKAQKVEEDLRSVDYDVWHCPSCNYHTVLDYTRWFSGYKICPECHRQTLEVKVRTLEEPTYTSTGRQEVTETCHHCSHNHVKTVTLARRQRSRSSSGSSSRRSSLGGGKSSGGGASGSW